MSTQEQARALMMRHSHLVKNRQQSMVNRVATEIGLEGAEYANRVQGRLDQGTRNIYDRSNAALS